MLSTPLQFWGSVSASIGRLAMDPLHESLVVNLLQLGAPKVGAWARSVVHGKSHDRVYHAALLP